MATKKFTISMPEEAYAVYKEKAEKADLSISQFLYRAGSIITIEQAVMFPLTQNNAGAITQTEQNK